MICVHSTDPTYLPASFKANGWLVDAKAGVLTVTDSGRDVAVFAPTTWRYVEAIEDGATVWTASNGSDDQAARETPDAG